MKHTGRLSRSFVERVSAPGRYGDGRGGFGLSLLVKPRAGGGWSKTYSQRLRVQGRVVVIGLGPHPLQTLDKARGIAVDNARVAWEGGDPRRQVVKIPTFGEAAELVIAAHVESWKDNGKTEKDWRAILRDYVLPKLGNRRVDQLDTQEVGAVLSPIWNAKRPTAEKARRRISAIMAWAVAQGHRADNPCADLTAILGNGSHKTKHQEALPHAAVGAALATIRASDGWVGARDALEFLILTAARSGEVRGARWDEIDLDAATWAIPADHTKTGAEHVIPLSVRAVAVVTRAQGYADASGLVFPSATGREMAAVILRRVLDASKVKATVHGFRSSFRDWAAETGVDRQLAESALGHVVGGVEGAYLRSALVERRRPCMQAWADYVG